ncbi:hypothetical protein H2203_007664 [Taxawa tesnikishii (nom. ined.)]|nr:hypothetical protein H2203_007664 [Dothideales sp. JES 119]
MVPLRSLLALLSTTASLVAASPVQKRTTVIDHDAVVGFAQTVPSGTEGTLYLKYKPHLYVTNGCVPYPAVDAAGDVSGGLAPTGGTNSDCSSSTGQIYARAASYGGNYAIIYAWFMPKDEPEDGVGHRYDWEGTIVWLDSTQTKLLGLATSAHGDWDTQSPATSISGTSPLIEYVSYFPLDHQTAFTSTVGGTQPLVAWESLTAAAKATLQTFDFGSANVPFNDNNFENNLAAAAL